MDELETTESVNVEEVNEVTDADLDAAFQDFMGDSLIEEPVEEVITETVVEETPQIPHPESSRLGRKVKFMEENMVSKREFAQLNSKLDQFFDMLNRKPEEKEVDEYGNEIEKPVDIDRLVDQKIVQHRERERIVAEETNKKYESEYVGELRSLINEIEDPVVARQVFKKMTEPGGDCNKRLSNNPFQDCSKNFIRAVKAVSTPFSGKRGSAVPTGVSATTVNTEAPKHIPKLDPDAEDFAKSFGMSADEIIGALDGEIPDMLKGTKRYL